MKLILASASPRRRHLLKKLGIPFRVKPSHVSEESSIRQPVRLVRHLAQRKAKATARVLKEGIVLGADTIVVLRNQILGKPKNPQDAYGMLYRLSGSRHRVYTGISLVDAATGRNHEGHAVSIVRMKKMPIADIERLSRKHLDKAGAYAIQAQKDPIAVVEQGSYDNVVGLPVKLVKTLLKKHFPDV